MPSQFGRLMSSVTYHCSHGTAFLKIMGCSLEILEYENNTDIIRKLHLFGVGETGTSDSPAKDKFSDAETGGFSGVAGMCSPVELEDSVQ